MSEKLIVIPFDKSCAITAIEVYSDLVKNNMIIDLANILIDATALTHNIPIATLNKKQRIIIFSNHGSQEVAKGLEKKILKDTGIN